jgi:phosphodiesterase/alkaline phosphatase D-like protein
LDQPPLAPEPGVICGPLLNFKHLSGEGANRDWHGSVLLVLPRETPQPTLEVDFVDIIGHSPEPSSSEDLRTPDWHATRVFQGEELYHDGTKAFWRFPIKLHVMRFESRWQYRVPTLVAPRLFCLPSRFQSMRIMFHSCNGFSIGTDMKVWKGGSLWHDVLRMHRSRPFHVMIGGGDQIYNDNVRTDGPLQAWTNIGNPLTRRSHHFDENLRRECDDFYYNNYVRWFNTQPFRNANCSIPQLNIWDDHDIIDGFGSYTDGFMRCNVFRGIGSVAHK